MNVSIITLLRKPLVRVGSMALLTLTLTQCGEQTPADQEENASPPNAATPGGATQTTEGPPAVVKLEDVIRGVWQSTDLERMDSAPEKIQLDFRANGEVTMIIYRRGHFQKEGKYEVVDGKLTLQITGQEGDTVDTKFDGKTLTIIDVDSGNEVDFEKL